MERRHGPMKMLELYSGIGGMRFAMEKTGLPHKICAAIDVNPVVNAIYRHNFGDSNHFQRNIESLTSDEIDRMNIDILTMSPPCQPFTRIGLKKDVNDARTDSFLHVLKILSELQHKPRYLLLENVKGFEESLAHSALLQALELNGYYFQEFLLSPLDFGIPNSRLRFYLIAKLKPEEFCFPLNKSILLEMPDSACKFKYSRENLEVDSCQIEYFLEDKSEEYFDSFLVPDKILLKYSKILDIIYKESSHSCCFTKGYGRYALGTGSVLSPASAAEVQHVYETTACISNKTMELELLKKLRLRYFTPREVANLMCFPKSFSFPSSATLKQHYQALGNSINVHVVCCLMKLLLRDHLT